MSPASPVDASGAGGSAGPGRSGGEDAQLQAAENDLGARPSPVLEKACALVCLAVGLAIIVGGRSVELRNETGGIDPRFWPTAIGVGVVLAALWATLNAFTGRRGEREVDAATRDGWRQLIATVLIAAAVLGVWYSGVSFLILAPIFLIGLNLVFGLRDLKSLIIFPAVLTGFLYLIFHLLLEVPL